MRTRATFTRKRLADPTDNARDIATLTTGREQPSGQGSGSRPCRNRGVLTPPLHQWRGLSVFRARHRTPRWPFYFSACKSSVWRDLPKEPSRTLVHRPSVSTDNLAFSSRANHGGSSRLPSRRQPFPCRNLKTRVEGAPKPRRSASESYQDLTVVWRSIYAAAKATTPCKRGVSDPGCGREHDRRRGQISWSLTPRSARWRDDDLGGVERSATDADRMVGTRNRDRTSTCDGQPSGLNNDWCQSDRRSSSTKRGNTPRWALFPVLFPPRAAGNLLVKEGPGGGACLSFDRRDKIAQSQRPPGSGRCGYQCLARQSWRTWL